MALPNGVTDPGVLLYFHQGQLTLHSGPNLAVLNAPYTGPDAELLY